MNLILWRLVLPMCLLVAGSGCNSNSTPTKTPEKKASRNDDKADFTMTASELLRDYLANRAVADKKYKGKKLDLNGKVFLVLDVPGKVGGPHFSFSNPGPGPDSVTCVFERKEELTPYKTGQPARIVGKCDGAVKGSTGGIIVVIRECKPTS